MEESMILPFFKYDTIVFMPDLFSSEEIDDIHKVASSFPLEPGLVGGPHPDAPVDNFVGRIDHSIRDSELRWMLLNEQSQWIYGKIIDGLKQANENFFHYDLGGMNTLQYTIYGGEGGKYGPHVDYPGANILHPRKISISIQLSDEDDYEGGDLLLYPANLNPKKCSRKKGDAVFFNSQMIHEVTPVTSGQRSSLVTWVYGPPWK